MSTMRSYSFIIASSTAAFGRPFTIASIYHQGTQFPSSWRLPPTPSRRVTMASFTNPRSGSSCRRRCRSRILQQHDPFCNIKVASSSSSSSSSSSIPTTTTTTFFSEKRDRYYNPISAMICLTSSRNVITNTPPRTSSSLTTTTTRLFGCNPNNSPHATTSGDIFLSDDRDDDIDNITTSTKSTISIDLTALRNTIQVVREIIGYPTYDISLTLVNDTYMQQLNADSRGISSPTDVLSFSLRDDFVEPGVLKEEQFDRDEYYDLGELFIDVDYVQRRCEEDRALHAAAAAAAAKEEQEGGGGERRESIILEGEVVSEIGDGIPSEHDKKRDAGEDDDADNNNTDEYEYGYMEVEVDDEYYYEDEYDDRGVAPAMQYIYDPEVRIHMLVVHGMLHLVGYDHETDDDYELMVVKEDEVLAELKRRLGEDFGLQRRLPSPSCE